MSDSNLVMNELRSRSTTSFFNALDLTYVGAFGHSLGGVVAARLCQTSGFIQACLNQDGELFGRTLKPGEVVPSLDPTLLIKKPLLVFTLIEPSMKTIPEYMQVRQASRADSRELIFHSAGGGRQEIYKQSLNGDSPELLVQDPIPPGLTTVSPDGKWLVYVRRSPASELTQLMRVPITGGTPQAVSSLQHIGGEPRCARPPSGMCAVFERTQDRKEIIITSFDPLKGLGALITRIAVDPNMENWSAYFSPDGTRIALMPQVSSRIKIFTIRGELIKEIQVKGLAGLTSSS